MTFKRMLEKIWLIIKGMIFALGFLTGVFAVGIWRMLVWFEKDQKDLEESEYFGY